MTKRSWPLPQWRGDCEAAIAHARKQVCDLERTIRDSASRVSADIAASVLPSRRARLAELEALLPTLHDRPPREYTAPAMPISLPGTRCLTPEETADLDLPPELKRRKVADYEDTKIAENGDVYYDDDEEE